MGLYCCFTIVFSSFTSFSENPSQARIVTEQIRGGSVDQRLNSVQKIKKIDLALRRRLEENFPDWDERTDYQEIQQHFYDLAIIKKREIKRLRMIDSPKFYTKEELDAMNYFDGTGFYKQYQDPSVRPNIFDSRQSFLMKMRDEKMRDT